MARSWLSVRPYGLKRLIKKLVMLVVCCLILYFAFFILFAPRDIALTNNSGENFTVKVKHVQAAYSSERDARQSGKLTLSVWRDLCGNEIKVLKHSPFYPGFPEERKFIHITEFHIEDNTAEYGQTITGFIHVPKSGSYRFAIASDDSSELWLSPSNNPREKLLIARVYNEQSDGWTKKKELNKYPTQISKDMNLRNGSEYYIEVIHKQGNGDGFVQVFWEGPGDAGFKLISSDSFSPYSDYNTVISTNEALNRILNMRLENSEEARQKYWRFLALPFISDENYLPPCTYESSFIADEQIKIESYNGLDQIQLSNVFPQDDTFLGKKNRVWSWRNRVADAKIVQSMVDKMISALCKKASK